MRIIDSHMHVNPTGLHDGKKASPEDLIKEMDKYGIEKGVVVAIEPMIESSFIRDVVERYPDRFIGCGSVNPHDKDAVKKLEQKMCLI